MQKSGSNVCVNTEGGNERVRVRCRHFSASIQICWGDRSAYSNMHKNSLTLEKEINNVSEI